MWWLPETARARAGAGRVGDVRVRASGMYPGDPRRGAGCGRGGVSEPEPNHPEPPRWYSLLAFGFPSCCVGHARRYCCAVYHVGTGSTSYMMSLS